MKKLFRLLILASIVSILFSGGCRNFENTEKPNFRPIKVIYPEAFQDTSKFENYHGLMVYDPYRWLEDDNSSATKNWITAQRSITDSYLEKIPFRQAIKSRLQTIWNYERYSNPEKKGGYYYIFKNNGLQNQDVLYRMKTLSSSLEVVLDPNTFSKDGTVSLGLHSFSKDGSLLAYQISEGGSDWRTILIKDLEKGELFDDTIKWVKFSSISWYGDGFFYSRYSAPKKEDRLSGKNQFHQLYYHKAGSPQSKDKLVFFDRVHPRRNFYSQTSEDERFLFLEIVESTSGNALYFKDIRDKDLDFSIIEESFDNDFEVVGNFDNSILIKTNYKAPNNRLIQVSVRQPKRAFWEEVIPESEDVLQSVKLLGGKLVATYIHNASSEVKIFSPKGRMEKKLKLPFIGTVTGFSGSKEDEQAFFSYTTFTRPNIIYTLNLKTYKTAVYKTSEIDFNSSAYNTRQLWYESYDGTKIPLFIIYKKGLRMDANTPALLYGYGGFDIPILPVFNRTGLNLFPIVLENNGICAVANLRGGGEFGKEWHEAGTKQHKQTVFDDFQAAAEYLIANRYTSSEKLAIYGRSNGGLLVGACMTQRPDLYKVALPAVGVLDMLRYHKFTIGWAWATDYGTSDEADAFDYLFSYSPLHNVAPEKYPATLVTTADHDDRVVPAHSFKFTSALQAKQQSDTPILIRIDSNAGHGAGNPTAKKIEEGADVLAFMFYNMQQEMIYEYGQKNSQ